MSATEEPVAKRSKLNDEELEEMAKDKLISLLRSQDQYIDSIETKNSNGESVTELEEKIKQGVKREQVLVMRLTTKEHEMQEYLNQIQELKQANTPSTSQLRSALLDPAVNLTLDKLTKELEETKQKHEQTKNDLSAWKFTADSQTGKRLMAKCRMLLLENEELGKVTSSGRIAKLEGEIALEKTLVQEMKKGQSEMDDFLLELEQDLEGMQSTIYLLQQQLKESKQEIKALKDENMTLKQQAKDEVDAGLDDKNKKAGSTTETLITGAVSQQSSQSRSSQPQNSSADDIASESATEVNPTEANGNMASDTGLSSGTEDLDSSPYTPSPESE